jgi:hypothetical protein
MSATSIEVHSVIWLPFRAQLVLSLGISVPPDLGQRKMKWSNQNGSPHLPLGLFTID